MKRFGTFRNDLVIGMTLAEVFLLLLIVGWYYNTSASEIRHLRLGKAWRGSHRSKASSQRFETITHSGEPQIATAHLITR